MFHTKNIQHFFIFLTLINCCYTDCITPLNNFKNILVLNTNNREILYSNDGKGNIVTKDGNFIHLACPGSKIMHTNLEVANFKCINNIYTHNSKPMKDLTCIDTITPIEKAKGVCANTHSLIQIGFEFGGTFISHIDVCWDNIRKRTLYTYTILQKQLGECHVESSRPSFRSGTYFSSSLTNWYTKHGQVYNQCTAYKGIPPQIDVFNNLLEIGHLVAKCDFVYDAQQRLTFQYTNAAPQWKSFNGGNWKLLEVAIRNLVAAEKSDLEIYTGTYGILKFAGQDYYLNNQNKEVPVPLYFWKVIIKKESATSILGLAIIGMNNVFDYNSKDNPCTDIKSQVHWLNIPKATTVKNGYIIACDVNEFKNINGLKNELPAFSVTGKLLGKPPIAPSRKRTHPVG